MLSNTNKKILAIIMVGFISLGFAFQNGYAFGKPKTKKAVIKKTVVKKTPSKDEIDAKKVLTGYIKELYNLNWSDMKDNDSYVRCIDKRVQSFKKYFQPNSRGYNNFLCDRIFTSHDTAMRFGKFNLRYISAQLEKTDEDKNYLSYYYKCKIGLQMLKTNKVRYMYEGCGLSLIKKNNKWFIDAVDFPIVDKFFDKTNKVNLMSTMTNKIITIQNRKGTVTIENDELAAEMLRILYVYGDKASDKTIKSFDNKAEISVKYLYGKGYETEKIAFMISSSKKYVALRDDKVLINIPKDIYDKLEDIMVQNNNSLK